MAVFNSEATDVSPYSHSTGWKIVAFFVLWSSLCSSPWSTLRGSLNSDAQRQEHKTLLLHTWGTSREGGSIDIDGQHRCFALRRRTLGNSDRLTARRLTLSLPYIHEQRNKMTGFHSAHSCSTPTAGVVPHDLCLGHTQGAAGSATFFTIAVLLIGLSSSNVTHGDEIVHTHAIDTMQS